MLMFLCVLGRPRYTHNRHDIFYDKIGRFVFVTKEKAKCNSRNSPAGPMETNPMRAIKDVYNDYLTTRFFPAIHAKISLIKGTPGSVQQDNSKPQISLTAIGTALNDGHSSQLNNWPPISPALKLLGSSYFNSINRIQYKKVIKSFNDHISVVQNTFKMKPFNKVSEVFLTCQFNF